MFIVCNWLSYYSSIDDRKGRDFFYKLSSIWVWYFQFVFQGNLRHLLFKIGFFHFYLFRTCEAFVEIRRMADLAINVELSPVCISNLT